MTELAANQLRNLSQFAVIQKDHYCVENEVEHFKLNVESLGGNSCMPWKTD